MVITYLEEQFSKCVLQNSPSRRMGEQCDFVRLAQIANDYIQIFIGNNNLKNNDE
ncbi:MAG: hypothetical protein KME64_33600 [Scytonematopsis contorta HA4267-MV1]|nr:hypothetical protein [Scytonematopsis contorta HA4267-MV1]